MGSLCKRQFISGTLAKMTLGLAVGMRSERLGVLLCIVCLFCDTSFDIKVCKLQMSLCSVLTTPRIMVAARERTHGNTASYLDVCQ